MPHHSALAYGRATLRMLAHTARTSADRFAACYLLSNHTLTVLFARNLSRVALAGPVTRRRAWQLIYDAC